jgi:26S proteasome regulatory subunit N9
MALDSSTYFDALSRSLSDTMGESGAQEISALKKYYERQLWHEFSSGILALIQTQPAVRVAAQDIHDTLLVPVRSNLDGSVYVKLLFYACEALASQGGESLNQVNNLLDSAIASLMTNGHMQCVSAVHCLKALVLMAHGPSLEAKGLLHKASDAIHATPVHDILPLLQALYFRAHVRQSELMCDYGDFYESAFAFLRYGHLAGLALSGEELSAVAYKTAIAALLASKVYNFGELLNTPEFVQALEENKSNPWALEVIRMCSRGDVTSYEQFVQSNTALLESMPDLADAIKTGRLGKKVRLMSLLQVVFHTPVDERVIPFQTVADRCNVSPKDVEPLLLTALAQHLIEGTIDELEGAIEVTWVQPRVMSIDEIASLAANIGKWRKVVKQTADHVGKMALKIAQ